MSFLHGVCLLREILVGVLGLGMVSLLDVLSLMGNDRSFRSQRIYGPQCPPHGTCSPPRRRMSVPPRSNWMDLANPTFEQMAWHQLDSFYTNPVLSHLLTLALVFHFEGGRNGEILVDRLRLLSTHDRRSKVVLQPHPGGVQGIHHFRGQWER
jgi:hypothetical protein